ncbi:MAG: cupin domain-containing protein [Pseudomonadota bacterium]
MTEVNAPATTLKTNLGALPNLVESQGNTLRRFGGESVMMQEAVMQKGTTFEPHQHHNEQLVLVLEGRLRLDVGPEGTLVTLSAGDLYLLPPHTLHGGEALEKTRLIDAFSPPRTTVLGEEEPE